ncbi:MAG: prepilin peptidase [bacterium]
MTEVAFPLSRVWLFIIAGIAGAVLGSFGNMLIWRLPRDESIVKPPSHCTKCGHKIRFFDNIPILSFVLLRGRCRDCSAPISPRYFLVELASALLLIGAAIAYGWSLETLFYGVFLWALLILAIIDFEHELLPFAITIPMTYFGLFGALLGATLPVEWALAGSAVGLLFLLALFYLVGFVVRREAMGEGDIVFGMMAGMYLGVDKTMLMMFLGSLLGVLLMVPLFLLRRKKASAPFPFGPFLAFSAALAIFFGAEIVRWYVELFG